MRSAVFVWLAMVWVLATSAPTRAEPPVSGSRVLTLIARGDAYRAAGDPTSAIAFYRDAIAAAPRDARGYDALGRVYLDLHESVRAVEAYEAGIRATRGESVLLLGLARAYEATGDATRALSTLRVLVVERPDSIEVLSVLAQAAERAGTWTEALAARRALIECFTEDPALSARVAEERARARAIELLLGATERVVQQAGCDPAQGPVRRALARCR